MKSSSSAPLKPTNSKPTTTNGTRSEAIRQTLAAFESAGIEMPEPTYRVLTGSIEAAAAQEPPAPAPPPESAPALSVEATAEQELAQIIEEEREATRDDEEYGDDRRSVIVERAAAEVLAGHAVVATAGSLSVTSVTVRACPRRPSAPRTNIQAKVTRSSSTRSIPPSSRTVCSSPGTR